MTLTTAATSEPPKQGVKGGASAPPPSPAADPRLAWYCAICCVTSAACSGGTGSLMMRRNSCWLPLISVSSSGFCLPSSCGAPTQRHVTSMPELFEAHQHGLYFYSPGAPMHLQLSSRTVVPPHKLTS